MAKIDVTAKIDGGVHLKYGEIKAGRTYTIDEEDFGEAGLLGRKNDGEVVLTREVLAALKRLNRGLPEDAYSQALAQVVQDDISKTLPQLNEEKYRLLRDGVPVQYRDASGRLVDKRLRLIDFDDPEQRERGEP